MAASWMYTDGSGLDVVIKGNEGVARGIVAVFTRDDVDAFTFSISEYGETLAQRLGRFEGTLVADAERCLNAVYAVYADGSVIEAGCKAHGICNFEAVFGEKPVLAESGWRFLQGISWREAEARERGLSGEERRAWQWAHSRHISDDLRRWLELVGPGLEPNTRWTGPGGPWRLVDGSRPAASR